MPSLHTMPLLEDRSAGTLLYFLKRLEESADLTITYQQCARLPQLHKETELYLYHVAEELLNNIVKHTSATRVGVLLNYRGNLINITAHFSVEERSISDTPLRAGKSNTIFIKVDIADCRTKRPISNK